MRSTTLHPLTVCCLLLAAASSLPAQTAPPKPVLAPNGLKPEAPKPPPPKAYADPAQTDDDFIIQGEYLGTDKEGRRFGTQVIALGDGKFELVGYRGGLPGDGWDGDLATVTHVTGDREEGEMTVVFNGVKARSEVDGARIFVTQMHKEPIMDLKRVTRVSPTEGAPPPPGAVVLFDGKATGAPSKSTTAPPQGAAPPAAVSPAPVTPINNFPSSRTTPDGLLMEGATSTEKFTDFTIHLEFRLPYMPAARGQGRGNSGIYLQGRYEVQMLDSFGLEGKDNECGGIYKVARPRLNLCYPPLSWQTYDIDFTAAKFDAEGQKTAHARITVKHNGVLIHENVEIPATTGSAPVKDESPAPGPIFLQNHGNPVRYRNIWVIRKN